MNENAREYDDLTVIKYIGPKLQPWLREKLQVRTYRDLATLSVEQIQTQLSADKRSVANFKIEIWIEQAEELALKAEEEDAALAAVEEPSDGSGAGEQPNPPKKAGDWKDFASFMVYFEAREINGEREKRIKVSHLEDDKSAVWSELTAEHFLWMLNQAGEWPFPNAPQLVKEEQPESEEPEPMEEAEVKVTQIRLFQPPEAKKPLAASNGKPVQQELNAGKPFALEVLFSLGGEGAESIVKQGSTYSVQVVAKESDTKAGVDLADSEPEALVEGKFDYSVRMPEATLDPGVHRLWAMVAVQAANTVPNFLEGPSVKVL